MYLKARRRLRRERSNQGPFKGRSLINFLQEQRAERSLTRSYRTLLLGLCVLISFACEPSAEIPPLEINSDVGQISSTPAGAQGPLKSRVREPNLKITVRSMLLAERVKLQLPEAVNTRFPSTVGYLWGWLELSNQGPETELLLRWERQGEVKGEFSFTAIQTPKMRSWTRLMLRGEDSGEWSLSLLNAKDRALLHRVFFEVYPPDEPNAQVPYINLLSTREPLSKDELPLTPKLIQGEPIIEEPVREERSTQARLEPASAEVNKERPLVESHSEVKRLAVSTSIKHRRPIGVSERFRSDVDRLWGYVEVKHSGPQTHLLMEWWREGKLRSRLKVRVGESLRWRTWSWQRLRPQRDAGTWSLKVLSREKTLLAETQFYVESLSEGGQ